jgi:hypothetical protein
MITKTFFLALGFAVASCSQLFEIQQSSKPKASNATVARSKRLVILAVVDKGASKARITLKWSLKNISKTGIRLIDSNILHDYKVLVTNESGEPAPLTQTGDRALRASYFSSRRLVKLRPGEESKGQIELSSFYDLKSGSVYTITIERQILRSGGTGTEKAESTPINIKIDD